ncbi:MAG: serine--tRNA ligase [Candidatus Nanoarchaeia archaeon]
MLDIKLIREKYAEVKKNLERRKDKEVIKLLAQVKEHDEEWRKAQYKMQEVKAERNKLNQEINKAKKAGKDVKSLIAKIGKLKKKLENATMICEDHRLRVKSGLMHLPNMLHESVPYGKDDTENVEVRKWGKAAKKAWVKPNGVIAEELGIADFERSRKISGAGFYFLKGDLVRLHQALLQFSLNHMIEKGFVPVEPPLMMRREPYEGVTDLSDFESVMYKCEGGDEYLIATSEHPIGAMHMNEVLDKNIVYVGFSPCFRREIGAHGIEEKGLFRTHQFFKVEQFVFCKPEDSWEWHEKLLENSEEIMKLLELPYRVVNICTGDIGIVAAKKYDIEVWMPSRGEYKEIMRHVA